MAAAPPSKSKSGTKSAVSDAYAGAKAEAGGPNMAPSGPGDSAGGPAGMPDPAQKGIVDPTAGDPMAAITHLTNLLISKGILSPHDLMLLPQAPSPLPQPAPMGGDPSMQGGAPPMPPQ